MNMRITIQDADNGFIAIHPVDGEDPVHYVFEGEMEEALANLLTHLAETLGNGYDKWGHNNFKITFDGEGHKNL